MRFVKDIQNKKKTFRLLNFATRRYLKSEPLPESALVAWQTLGNSVYWNNPSRFAVLMLHRPSLSRSQSVS